MAATKRKRRTPEERARDAEATARMVEAKLRAARTRVALSTYKAATRDRFTRDWTAQRKSADAAIIPDLPTLHARARQLVRDDVYARSAVRALVRNVVGRGIGCVASREVNGQPDTAWNRAADRLWSRWARDHRRVDRERRRNLAGVLRWVVHEEATAGEALIVMGLEDRIGVPRLVLQCVEADQLDTTRTEYQPVDPAGRPLTDAAGRTVPPRQVHGGVEVDECGAALAYWILPAPPGGVNVLQTQEARRIPADRVLHYFDPDRARQTRGVTRLACAMLRLRHLAEYDSAQLVAARAEASLGLVVETQQPDLDFGTPDGTTQGENDELKMLPMMVAKTLPGEKVTQFTPQRPGGLYRDFTQAQLRGIAAGIGLGYEQVARDFTNGSYSSQRQALLEDRREFGMQQDGLVTIVLRPIYELFIREAVLDGLLRAPDFDRDPDAYTACEVMVDGFEWIDPEKEAKANATALASNLDTRKRIAGERGLDWRAIDAQRAIEREAESGPGTPDGAAGAARVVEAVAAAAAVGTPPDAVRAILRRADARLTPEALDQIVQPLERAAERSETHRRMMLQALGAGGE